MGFFYSDGNQKLFDTPSSPDKPLIIETFYISKEQKDSDTILFCPTCEINFFAAPVETNLDLIAVKAAEAIAVQHAERFEHQVYRAMPERRL